MRETLKQFRRIFSRQQKIRLLYLMMGLIFCSILDSLVVALMSPFTVLLMNAASVFEHPRLMIAYQLLKCQTAEQFLAWFSVGIALIFLFRGLLRYALQRRQAKLNGLYRAQLSRTLFQKVIMQPYRYHITHTSSQLQQLLIVQVSKTFSLLDSILSAISAISVGICIVVVLLFRNWLVTVGLVTLLTGMMLVINFTIKQSMKKSAATYNAAYSSAIKWVYQALGAIKETIAKNRRAYFVNAFAEYSGMSAQAYARYLAWQATPKLVIETFSLVLVFSIAALMIGTGGDTAGFLPLFATFALAATRLIPLFHQTSSALNAIVFYQPALTAVYETCTGLEIPALLSCAPDALAREHPHLMDSIQLKDVSFAFEDSKEPLLEGVTFTVRRGESVAVVGPSGAGKTTLIDIILGLYTPTGGKVVADGVDIHQNPTWWATMVGYISQTIYLCEDSIRANVAFGEKAENIDDAKVWRCLAHAQLESFVQAMPDGLNTLVGENGIRLSQGQRQRIGIARALYCDPDVLVMDEATSALDTDTEAAVIEAVNALAGEKTLIIVAHRLTTIRKCDRVYRVEGGTLRLER